MVNGRRDAGAQVIFHQALVLPDVQNQLPIQPGAADPERESCIQLGLMVSWTPDRKVRTRPRPRGARGGLLSDQAGIGCAGADRPAHRPMERYDRGAPAAHLRDLTSFVASAFTVAAAGDVEEEGLRDGVGLGGGREGNT